MKMSILKSGLLLLALFATAALTSCKKDDDNPADELKEQIAGIWDITSFKVAGLEYMNTVVEAASIEYEAFSGAQGDFLQTIKYLDEDPEETNEGKYEILGANSVKMISGGESYTLKVTIDGDSIQLEGEQDGEPLVIKAKRRDEQGAGNLKAKIVGAWDFTSYKIGGQEYLNVVVASGSIRYDAFTGAQGDFLQKVKFKDGSPEEAVEGKYEVLDNNRVKMITNDETHTFRVAVTGDEIQLEGAQDGLSVVIKAKKRN